MIGSAALQEIDRRRAVIVELSRRIWENPEPGFKEFQAAELTARVLREAGFEVETGAGGLGSAVKASFGSGGPAVAFLGEFDALPGLSQKISTQREALTPGAPGHACGHNLICAAHVGAVLGLKEEMVKNKLPGKIVFFACPGEELLTGKGFMARAGLFDGLDAAVNFHPNKASEVTLGTSTAVNSCRFHFLGRAAHAGSEPHKGRSALDAVELTNVGANYLREHLPPDVRLHYIITEGGAAPNIVPEKASVWYYVRALSREATEDAYERLVQVARGAAMMTGVKVEVEFLGGCYNTMGNRVLSEVVHEAMGEIQPEPWTEEEKAFAAALDAHDPEQCAAMRKKYGQTDGQHLYEGGGLITSFNSYGSTDLGDVMHIVPTAYFFTGCTSLGTPNHSWQFCACAGGAVGEKGMLLGARIMAVFGAKLLNDPAILKRAKAEFDQAMAGRVYKCPLPDGLPAPAGQ
ncbi:MAG: amidohydrolase [Candidatus Adiutrix sp.]|jgi:aminobenzoyl-glutamate utilization protein B|nr:amidohydrolase [Candidatus Adiutrix sp.]